jgi:hypothetical protein
MCHNAPFIVLDMVVSRHFYIKNIYIVRHAHFLKKIKGYFREYEMGIGDTHYLKFNKDTAKNNKTTLLNERNEV